MAHDASSRIGSALLKTPLKAAALSQAGDTVPSKRFRFHARPPAIRKKLNINT